MIRLCAVAFAWVLVAPFAALPAAGGGPVLVLLPPWTDADAIVTSAGGRLIGPVRAPFAVLAEGGASFPEQVRQGGAWAVADGAVVARICGAM
jgi:hypothetical protein